MSEGRYVLQWEDLPSGIVRRWFKRMYSAKQWLENPLDDAEAHVEVTQSFRDAYVFDSFEEAYKVFDAPAVKRRMHGKLGIRYYTDKEYFKEKLRRE